MKYKIPSNRPSVWGSEAHQERTRKSHALAQRQLQEWWAEMRKLDRELMLKERRK